MNKYLRALIVIPTGFLKTLFLKIFHPVGFKGVQFAQVSPFSEITIEGGILQIGRGLKMRDSAKIRVRKGAKCIIGDNVSFSSQDILTCHYKISIGSGCEFSPGVLIYDHDHDFRSKGGIKDKKYKEDSIVIGNNVWVGCNTVILKGTTIGDNAVIAAGSVVRGDIPPNTVFFQRRINEAKPYLKD